MKAERKKSILRVLDIFEKVFAFGKRADCVFGAASSLARFADCVVGANYVRPHCGLRSAVAVSPLFKGGGRRRLTGVCSKGVAANS
jgi:hypothetical protein